MFDIFGEMDMTISKFFEDVAAFEQAIEDSENELQALEDFTAPNFSRICK